MLKKTSIDIKDFEFETLTNVGWKPIDYVHKTEKDRKYIVLFESGIEIDCADTHAFISIDNKEITTKNLKIGDKILSKDGYDIVFDIFKTNEYEHFYDTSLNSHYKYYTNDILSHNTTLLINMIERMSAQGKNVILFSMETSEDQIAQRIDSISTLSDINRMYTSKNNIIELSKKLKIQKQNRGLVIIKEFPTGQASTGDFRNVLTEYKYRNIKFDCVLCDYMTIMKPEYKSEGDLYRDGKRISEELRALSLEVLAPFISVSQLNREGIMIDFKDVDYTHIGECLSIESIIDHKEMGKIKLKDLNVGDIIENNEGYVNVKAIRKTRKKKYIIKTKSGKTIECSVDHRFPSNDGVKSIKTGLELKNKLFINIHE